MKLQGFVFFLLAFSAIPSFAQEEILEDAVGLEESEATSQMADTSEPTKFPGTYRAYAYLEASRLEDTNSKSTHFGLAEIGGNVAVKYSLLTAFFDGFVAKTTETNADVGQFYTNQLGLRLQLNETLNVAAGKERNRRSPGLIVSPSDFLYFNNAIPGQREQREGVWGTRASWQTSSASVDVIALPGWALRDNGLPEVDSKQEGIVARAFLVFGDADASFAVGKVNGEEKIGLSVQTFLFKLWRTYFELRLFERGVFSNREERSTLSLFGVGYDGFEEFLVRLEYFRNGGGIDKSQRELLTSLVARNVVLMEPSISSSSALFFGQDYVIGSVSYVPSSTKGTLAVTSIVDVYDVSHIILTRASYNVSSQSTFGGSIKLIDGKENSLWRFVPQQKQYSLDFTYSF